MKNINFNSLYRIWCCLALLWIWGNLGLWKFSSTKFYVKLCLRLTCEIKFFSLLKRSRNDQTILRLLFCKIFSSACFWKLSIKLALAMSSSYIRPSEVNIIFKISFLLCKLYPYCLFLFFMFFLNNIVIIIKFCNFHSFNLFINWL